MFLETHQKIEIIYLMMTKSNGYDKIKSWFKQRNKNQGDPLPILGRGNPFLFKSSKPSQTWEKRQRKQYSKIKKLW